jgi:hypothetical protein
MSSVPETRPVAEDDISKVNDDVAVGADLDFQRRWWRGERVIWIIFAAILVSDVLGCFGRGPLAKAHLRARDASMEVDLERIERFGTPSVMNIRFGPAAIHDGQVRLWVSESLIKSLGNQRVVPQPATSVLSEQGILYTFPATGSAAGVAFAMQPAKPGLYDLALRVPGFEELRTKVVVMP